MRLRQQEVELDGRLLVAQLEVVEADDVVAGVSGTKRFSSVNDARANELKCLCSLPLPLFPSLSHCPTLTHTYTHSISSSIFRVSFTPTLSLFSFSPSLSSLPSLFLFHFFLLRTLHKSPLSVPCSNMFSNSYQQV